LCTESSWDPDEDDEREVEDVLMNEADLKKRSMLQSEVLKRRRDQEDDIYGREDDRHGIFTARHPHDNYSKPLDEDDLSELSNQEEEIEYDKYLMEIKKHEKKRQEAIKKQEAKF
jgi:hypothetical protein